MNKKIVFLDMDDVLCDWHKTVAAEFGFKYVPRKFIPHNIDQEILPYESFEIVSGVTTDVFHGMVNSLGKEWWANLKPLPAGIQLYNTLHNYSSVYGFEIIIASSIHEFNGAADGKLRWLQTHIKEKHKYVFTREKHLLANSNRLLIDDNVNNCLRFRLNGGKSFIWNTFSINDEYNRGDKEIQLKSLEGYLREFLNED